ncbi:MAG TPA: hypothetical protein VM889_11870 [Candidatus Thermoplasmatota archaeon]|nr:hypothetical protein [Candidatus Thermoplasmatota archaeon]
MKTWIGPTLVAVEVVLAVVGWFLADLVVGPITRFGCNVARTASACQATYDNVQAVGFVVVFLALLALIGTGVVLVQERARGTTE